jgi:hypothetical protein
MDAVPARQPTSVAERTLPAAIGTIFATSRSRFRMMIVSPRLHGV